MWNVIIISLLLAILIMQTVVILLLCKGKQAPAKTASKEESETKETIHHNRIETDEEIKRTTELQLLRMRNAVQRQCEGIHKKEMELAPGQLIFDHETLKKVYNEQEMESIRSFTHLFSSYLATFWLTKDGRIKSVFSGRADDKNTEAGRMAYRSHELCREFDELLNELFHHS